MTTICKINTETTFKVLYKNKNESVDRNFLYIYYSCTRIDKWSYQ